MDKWKQFNDLCKELQIVNFFTISVEDVKDYIEEYNDLYDEDPDKQLVIKSDEDIYNFLTNISVTNDDNWEEFYGEVIFEFTKGGR